MKEISEVSSVVCAPDTDVDTIDGAYVTFEYLAQLIGRAKSTHCATCTCDVASE